MNEKNMALENTSLFLALDQAVLQLAELIAHCEKGSVLLIVLCQDAMLAASEIAGRLGVNLIFSPVDLNARRLDSRDKGVQVDFDYGMVKESGRDMPQDFIGHQEQNLKADLICVYTETYERLTKTYPDKLIILVDQLTNIDAVFFPCLTQKYPQQPGESSSSTPSVREFVYLHVPNGVSGNSITQGFNIIVEHSFREGD